MTISNLENRIYQKHHGVKPLEPIFEIILKNNKF